MRIGSVTFDAAAPVIMGILNVTPDSFADGGRFTDVQSAIQHAEQMVLEGVDIIDIGGQSTRPGSLPISVDEELARVLPVITALHKQFPKLLLSIDTDKAAVAKAAVEAGVQVVNDVTALTGDPAMAQTVAALSVSVVLMHLQGKPQTMQQSPTYQDVVTDVLTALKTRIDFAVGQGIARERLIVDPGIGFGKTVQHNLTLLKQLAAFQKLDCPILIGTSLKSFIGATLDVPVEGRLSGTLASIVWAYSQGARIFRVHHVKPAREALLLTHAIMEAP